MEVPYANEMEVPRTIDWLGPAMEDPFERVSDNAPFERLAAEPPFEREGREPAFERVRE